MSGPYAQQQKMLLYVLPVAFAAGGVAFPIGVLVYWTTTNLWTMGQQFYVIRRNPAPGTPAFEAKVARDRAKGRTTELEQELAVEDATHPENPPRQRQQPKRQTREQRKKRSGGAKPGDKAGQDPAKGAGKGADRNGNPRADDTDDTDEGKTA
jgi:YidC/Oxa1 family membrane protein insertase